MCLEAHNIERSVKIEQVHVPDDQYYIRDRALLAICPVRAGMKSILCDAF
jgi:hypothetical protein